MRTYKPDYIIFSAIALTTISVIALAINHFFYQFPGNNYYPTNTLLAALSLGLIYTGFYLQLGRTSKLTLISKDALYFFLVMALLAQATNAAQYTPFPIIDKYILAFEALLHIDMEAIMDWTHAHPLLKNYLAFAYDSLPYQMAYIPLIFIATGKFHLLREYYFLLLSSALIAFSFYYFFPTTAPASMINSDYFSIAQKATGLKFTQIHQHIQPTTINGGMIAMPSLHAIWAWFCLHLLRGWPIAFVLLLPLNILLVASCVLLGWHYTLDLLGSILTILICHRLNLLRIALQGRNS